MRALGIAWKIIVVIAAICALPIVVICMFAGAQGNTSR